MDTIRSLEGIVDIYLPDFKYFDTALSAKYSHAPDYPAVAKAVIAEWCVRRVRQFLKTGRIP